jgi:hypothetical protein
MFTTLDTFDFKPFLLCNLYHIIKMSVILSFVANFIRATSVYSDFETYIKISSKQVSFQILNY